MFALSSYSILVFFPVHVSFLFSTGLMCHAYFHTKHVLYLLSPYSCIFLVFTAFMYSYCFHAAHVVLLFSSFPCATLVLTLYFYSSHLLMLLTIWLSAGIVLISHILRPFSFSTFFLRFHFAYVSNPSLPFCYSLFRLFFLSQPSLLFPSFFPHSFNSASGLPLLRVSIAERQNRCLRERGADSVIFTKYTSFKQR